MKKEKHFSNIAINDLYTIFRNFGLQPDEIEKIIDRGPLITFEKIIELTKESLTPKENKPTERRLKVRILPPGGNPFSER